MKQELDRVKNDVETMQKAMGIAPEMGRDWIHWMKRDNWLFLWWCLPGAILIAASFLPSNKPARYFGLVLAQWTGILVAAIMGGIFFATIRRTLANDGRPQSLIREYRRFWGFDAQGKCASVAMALVCLLYVLWAWHFRIGTAFGSGFCILFGSMYLVIAVFSRLWLLLGLAVPILGYGLLAILLPGNGKVGEILLGITCIGIGLSSYLIQVWQIRKIEQQNESH